MGEETHFVSTLVYYSEWYIVEAYVFTHKNFASGNSFFSDFVELLLSLNTFLIFQG